ncbi:hypothetical protein ACFL60_03430 [Candidatus Omnitrophota bacterium]
MNGSTVDIEKVSVHLQNINAYVLALLITMVVAYSIWYYRTTIPAVSGLFRRMLFSLRTAACIILVIGLSEPVVTIIRTVTKEFGVAVLLDTSSSMNQTLDTGRKEQALEALNSIRSLYTGHSEFYMFDSGIRSMESEVSFSGSGTDIFNALKTIGDKKIFTSAILISDGNWNLGHNPSGSDSPFDIPVFCIATGSGEESSDIVLSRTSVPSFGFDGASVPVELFVYSPKALSEPVRVEIREGQRTAASGTVEFGDGSLAKLTLNLPLNDPGDHTYQAVVMPDFEELRENNSRSFLVHVAKSAFRILVIADAPSPDFAFIRRIIEADEALDGVFVTGSGLNVGIDSTSRDDLSSFDSFIIIDGGGLAVTPDYAREMSSVVSDGAGLWILGSTPFPEQDSDLERILPVRYIRNREKRSSDAFMALTKQGMSHFITAGVLKKNYDGQWDDLPPLEEIAPVMQRPSSGTVLLNAVYPEKKETLPSIVTGKHGTGKVVVMPVSGIWRWHLMMEGAGKGRGFFHSFVLGTIRWLTSGADTSPLTVTTDSHTYLSGQEIVFEARLYDNIYSPVSDADITIVLDNDLSSKVILEETTPAVYTGIFRGASPGDHRYTSQAFVGGDLYAESTGQFYVDEFSLEMLDLKPDHEMLGTLAARTGGISVTPSGIDSVLALLEPRITSERSEKNHYVALSPFLPLFAVFLFAAEWGIRKQRGLM